MFLLILCVILCVRVRARMLLCESSSFRGVWLWDTRLCCLVCDDQHSGEPATSYTTEYSKRQNFVTHCSWHTIQDTTTQWPYGILMLCGQAGYCALLPVLLFFFCSWSFEIETLTHVTRDLQIHRKSSICFCHPWKTDRPDVIHRKVHETDSSGDAPHWTVIVHLFLIHIDTWLRWIMSTAQV
jgi:hypothetical protein